MTKFEKMMYDIGIAQSTMKCPIPPSVNSHCSDSHGSLDALIEKWEACAKSWMKVADERDEDPDLADRAAARAAIYQDCANDLKENDKD